MNFLNNVWEQLGNFWVVFLLFLSGASNILAFVKQNLEISKLYEELKKLKRDLKVSNIITPTTDEIEKYGKPTKIYNKLFSISIIVFVLFFVGGALLLRDYQKQLASVSSKAQADAKRLADLEKRPSNEVLIAQVEDLKKKYLLLEIAHAQSEKEIAQLKSAKLEDIFNTWKLFKDNPKPQ